MTELQKKLFALQDLNYREFHSRLMPAVAKEKIIGVRTPQLRKFAKEFFETSEVEEFLLSLPHKYYEEDNLHGFLLEMEDDYDSLVEKMEQFLPCVDNWATCDMMRPKIFKKHLPELYEKIKQWIQSQHSYTIRYGIGMLLSFYLDEEFDPKHLEMVAEIHSEEYYVNMMIAWYFATALAKQWDTTIIYIEEKKLGKWIHNKTIQKAIESYRITKEQKEYLRSWRMK